MTGKDMFDFGGVLYEDDEEAGGAAEDWDISRLLARYVSEACECDSNSDSNLRYHSERRSSGPKATSKRTTVREEMKTRMEKKKTRAEMKKRSGKKKKMTGNQTGSQMG